MITTVTTNLKTKLYARKMSDKTKNYKLQYTLTYDIQRITLESKAC